MAIAITTLIAAAGDSTDATVYATASVAVTTGSVRGLYIYSAKGAATVEIPVPSGLGDTWTRWGTVAHNAARNRLSFFTGYSASPTNGVVTVTCSGITQTGMTWSLFEIGGGDTTTPVVQTATNTNASSTTLTMTLSALATTLNVAIGGFGDIAGVVFTAGAGFTTIGTLVAASPAMALLSEYLANTTTVNCSLASADAIAGLAFELAVAGAAATYGFNVLGSPIFDGRVCA